MIVTNTEGVSSSLGVNVSLATVSMIVFFYLFGPVLNRGKLVVCVRFNPVFDPLCNCHDRPNASFLPLVFLAGLP